jgi:hypothetical protein
MRSRMWGAAIVVAAVACAPRGDQQDRRLIEQGRLYTNWLYGSEYDKLWDRFSPEMRQTFGSVTDLGSFLGRAVTRLGPERGAVDERVESSEALRVYRRAASFDKSRQRMLIEWSLAQDGDVTGLVMRPEPSDSM